MSALIALIALLVAATVACCALAVGVYRDMRRIEPKLARSTYRKVGPK